MNPRSDRFRGDRRAFLRRSVGFAPPAGDPAWDAVYARAQALGIVPGTAVDAQGRPAERRVLGYNPLLGEVMPVAFDFAPRGWAPCNGQVLSIAQNQALFALLGTTYGGNGQTTFALPNLQGRIPMHVGTGFTLGQAGGEAAHTLTLAETPAHLHANPAATAATTDPAGARFAASPAGTAAFASAGGAGRWPSGVGGGGQPHENRPPHLALTFCIATQGIFPSRD